MCGRFGSGRHEHTKGVLSKHRKPFEVAVRLPAKSCETGTMIASAWNFLVLTTAEAAVSALDIRAV